MNFHAMLRAEAALHVSPATRALAAAYQRDREELAADLMDKAAEAVLGGNPARAHYYDQWAARAWPDGVV